MLNTDRSILVATWVLLTVGVAALAAPAAAAQRECAVTIAVDVTEEMGTIDFVVDYSDVQGTFSQKNGASYCTTLVRGARIFSRATCDAAYESCQWGANRRLNVDLMFDAATTGPADLLTCSFLSDQNPAADGFVVNAATASDFRSGSALTAFPPHVFARAVECQ